ncbi:Cysteine-rich secretory protein family protein [Planococcus massiliensis]|uniref:Cysteine-rich secretory protein family protein n=1 Tax=Planococcus massiliensis TaxID=1499687 RepID=A0A098EKC5_9BACL|nr:CAP-associated domain-containing protein [Planococcus massiliensis]CEG22372.1 Cysteine-rich secretory protein family protein [Planococcus massiliensis]
MKDLLKIMIFLSIILIVFFYFDSPTEENEVLEAPPTMDPLPAKDIVEKDLDVERPAEGISTYIGQDTDEWLNDYGMPDRIEPSAFGYEWWIYNSSFSNYMMVGVKNSKTVQVYTAGTATNAAPYEIGQTLDELYRFTIVENEITVKYGTNIYTFNLGAEDINRRLLVSFDEVYAQLYIDVEDDKLEAVRFMDAETLIRHQPYDMMFVGDLLPSITPSSSLQQSIDDANAKQIVDLTNVYRLHHQRKPLYENPSINLLARAHSENTAKKDFSSQEIELENLNDRLTAANILFDEAGENTATQYFDAAEAVHGWINSSDHRETLLSDKFNQIGVGVFGKYYTQNFIYQEPASAEKQ